jgi:hypothetical protein
VTIVLPANGSSPVTSSMLSVEMLLSDGDRDKEPLLAGVAVSSEKQQPLVDAVRNRSSSVSVSISRDWRFSSFYLENYLN